MIKLKKSEKPSILVENERAWTEQIMEKAARGESPTAAEKGRYRHRSIKDALVVETHGKCAYCESKILHVGFGDVDHISPKSVNIENFVKWENLTLACDRCNTYKAAYTDLIDPYVDEPADCFVFHGNLVLAFPDNYRATFTETCLRLNRGELLERRYEKIKYLESQLRVLHQAPSEDLKDILRRDLIANEMHDGSEFAATARSYLNIMLAGPISAGDENQER